MDEEIALRAPFSLLPLAVIACRLALPVLSKVYTAITPASAQGLLELQLSCKRFAVTDGGS